MFYRVHAFIPVALLGPSRWFSASFFYLVSLRWGKEEEGAWRLVTPCMWGQNG